MLLSKTDVEIITNIVRISSTRRGAIDFDLNFLRGLQRNHRTLSLQYCSKADLRTKASRVQIVDTKEIAGYIHVRFLFIIGAT